MLNRRTGCFTGVGTLLVWLLFAPGVPAAQAPRLEIYVRDGCPHCAAAETWLDELESERPELEIVRYHVDRDPAARERLVVLTREAGLWPPGVPTFVVGGAVKVGFHSGASSGPAIRAWLDEAAAGACPGGGPCEPGETVPELAGTPWPGSFSVEQLGLPAFTLALGLFDGFNPCAMWMLLFLLSLLVNLHDRARMALIAGTFVLVGGAVYFAFLAAWLNLFLAIGFSLLVRLLLGAVALAIGVINIKDFFALGRGPSLSIPGGARPGLYARVRAVLSGRHLPASLLAVAGLAILVNFVELLCTAGLPAVYTAVLTQQGLSTAAYYAYLGLYTLAYMADDTLMVALAVYSLTRRRLDERAGRWLKLMSGTVMLALGTVLLVRPRWLL